jgi:DNA-directed RNA polymerase subunit RPC12/RpoP
VADLGNLNGTLRLHCKDCGWRPPEDAVMEAVQLHFQVEHDTDQVTLDLLAVCACGAAMGHTVTKPTGGGFKDYVLCPACGSAGFVKRDA